MYHAVTFRENLITADEAATGRFARKITRVRES